MNDKESVTPVKLQQQPQQAQTPGQAPSANDQNATTIAGEQWQPKASYEVHAGSPEYDSQLSHARGLGYLFNVLIALALCAAIVLSSTPGLPSYNTDPGNYRSMPATPTIGFAYLVLDIFVICRIILAFRKSSLKKRKEAAQNPVQAAAKKQRGLGAKIAVAVGVLCLMFVTPVGWVIFALTAGVVYCNFTSCPAS